jgi:hypothetical protein
MWDRYSRYMFKPRKSCTHVLHRLVKLRFTGAVVFFSLTSSSTVGVEAIFLKKMVKQLLIVDLGEGVKRS